MLKTLIALIGAIFLAVFSSPYFFLKDSAIIVKGGKSSGEFIENENLSFCDLINADGVVFYLSSEEELKTIKEKLSLKPAHYFFDGEIENYYFYSEKLPKKEIICGKKVNVHVAITSSKIILGAPLIYYGY